MQDDPPTSSATTPDSLPSVPETAPAIPAQPLPSASTLGQPKPLVHFPVQPETVAAVPDTPQPAPPAPEISPPTYTAPTPPIDIKPRRTILPLLVVSLLVLALAGAAFAWVWTHRSLPVSSKAATSEISDVKLLFQDAVAEGLTTGQILHQVSSADGSHAIAIDVSSPTNPHISITGAQRTSTVGKSTTSTYASLQNSYIQYQKASAGMLPPADIGSWIQIRRNGVLPAKVNTLVEQMTDPRYLLFGPYIFGNFSDAQRTALTSFLSSNPVYQFDTSKVTAATLGGHDVYVYDVTYNVANLKAYNLKVAAMMGLAPSDIQLALDSFGYYGQNKVYIERDTKHLVQVTYQDVAGLVTAQFLDYGKQPLAPEPVSSLPYIRVVPAPSL